MPAYDSTDDERDEIDENYRDEGEVAPEDFEEGGCCFPGACLFSGDRHNTGECQYIESVRTEGAR